VFSSEACRERVVTARRHWRHPAVWFPEASCSFDPYPLNSDKSEYQPATEQLLLRKLKPKRCSFTRPRSALSTRPSRSDRGLIIGASVAFLTGRQRRSPDRTPTW